MHQLLRVLTMRHLPASLDLEPRALPPKIAKGLVIDRWRHQEVERAYAPALADRPPPTRSRRKRAWS